MVMVLAFHEADNPAGNPVAAPIPVAPDVAMVIGDSALFKQTVGFELGVPAVFKEVTRIDAVLFST